MGPRLDLDVLISLSRSSILLQSETKRSSWTTFSLSRPSTLLQRLWNSSLQYFSRSVTFWSTFKHASVIVSLFLSVSSVLCRSHLPTSSFLGLVTACNTISCVRPLSFTTLHLTRQEPYRLTWSVPSELRRRWQVYPDQPFIIWHQSWLTRANLSISPRIVSVEGGSLAWTEGESTRLNPP